MFVALNWSGGLPVAACTVVTLMFESIGICAAVFNGSFDPRSYPSNPSVIVKCVPDQYLLKVQYLVRSSVAQVSTLGSDLPCHGLPFRSCDNQISDNTHVPGAKSYYVSSSSQSSTKTLISIIVVVNADRSNVDLLFLP